MDSGDRVRIIADETYEGILMPRPDILEKGIVVLKLDNGYNIGIREKNIKKTVLIKKRSGAEEKEKRIIQKKGLPKVSILSFGGTISSKIDYTTGGTSADYSAEDFIRMCPELGDIADLNAKKVMGKMSEDFVPDDWKTMAEAVYEEIRSGAEGVVITQGTDTLHFSTAALSFMLPELSVPVIFTASQRSIDRGSSDAFMNLVCAVNAAAGFDCGDVMTCLHGTTNDDYCLLIRGTKVRKMHTSRRDAFRPINDRAIAKVFPDGKIEIMNKNYRKKAKKTVIKTGFEEKVALLNVYPGFDPGVIDHYIRNKFRGIVIGATALGHVATSGKNDVLPMIDKAIRKGMIVVIATQTIYGSTHKYVYSNLRKLSVQLKCPFAGDMLPETAYIKLGWLIANSDDPKADLEKDLAGEINERSCKDFLN